MLRSLLFSLALSCLAGPSFGQGTIKIPRRHDKPPGPALTPEQAIAKMTVPEGFHVDLVAAEPQLVNPTAMTFDDRGRIWVCESIEYPRRSPGEGKDRIRILEDVDRDGRVDKSTVFMDGLNIPCGIAIGHGPDPGSVGVWISNAPDILYAVDTDGDDKADEVKTVVTGWGRTDTHELPNSLTWGPDGWLYGLNGVFNHSHVRYAKDNPNFDEKHPGWKTTCCLWRIYPRTWEFELYAEGTSNPWGIAFDPEGEAFVSACVIDHLWHIAETGYYHRQGGPYPPHTWKIESIVEHKHQKAAYCGLEYFDSPAYPEEYRNRLYMGNIHGGCINVDVLERKGSTYFAKPNPDFLTANDAWFMPIDQRVGPDGFLYVLDWYDRYHCYQDANADPAGIDRLNGRIYRVRYGGEKKPVPTFDLTKKTDDELTTMLGEPNVFYRRKAQRILQERNTKANAQRLLELVTDESTPDKQQRHALFALMGHDLHAHDMAWEVAGKLYDPEDAFLGAWGIRCLGLHVVRPFAFENGWDDNFDLMLGGYLVEAIEEKTVAPEVRREALAVLGALAAKDAPYSAYDEALAKAAVHAGDDPLLGRLVWQNLRPYVAHFPNQADDVVAVEGFVESPVGRELTPRLVEWLLDRDRLPEGAVGAILDEAMSRGSRSGAAGRTLAVIAGRVQSGELKGNRLDVVRKQVAPVLAEVLKGWDHPLAVDAAFLSVSLGGSGAAHLRRLLVLEENPTAQRLAAMDALIAAEDRHVVGAARVVIGEPERNSREMRGAVVSALGRVDHATSPDVAEVLLWAYPKLEPELQPRAIEVLVQRAAWAKQLLAAIGEKKIPATALNLNQVRSLLATEDEELVAAVAKHWGTVRTGRDPKREQKIAEWKTFVREHPGDPFAGEKVFAKVCGQCHTMYGKGAKVGPDITLNGRNSFDQLLSNVFDPSLVIGRAYQARTVVTTEGRVLNGLLLEENEQRIVLNMQGGKQETIPRDQIEILKVSEVSLMPEDLEKQLKPEEIADLFAYLVLDRPPKDPDARMLPGVRVVEPRSTTKPEEFGEILAEVAPGFTTSAVGEGGLALLAEHMGRSTVARTHPLSGEKPCVLSGTFDLPRDKTSKLLLSVAHHEKGDWRLVVRVDGEPVKTTLVGPKTTTNGWAEHSVDLSQFAGKRVKIELLNDPNDWSWEFAFWGRAAVVSE